MPPEPRRLGQAAKAVSERILSLITRTSPPAVRVKMISFYSALG